MALIAGWRVSIPNASGLLIWHIDESVTFDNYANANEARRLIDVVEANPVQEMEMSMNPGDTDDVWPGRNGYTVFDADSTPNSDWYGDDDSGVSIDNIAVTRADISADFTTTSTTPTSVSLQTQSTQTAVIQLLLVSVMLLGVVTVTIKRR